MNDSSEQVVKASDVARGDRLRLSLYVPRDDRTGEDFKFQAKVVEETPKAVRVQLEAARGSSRGLWLPRRALTHLVRGRHGVRARLARWWTPNEHQVGTLAACRQA